MRWNQLPPKVIKKTHRIVSWLCGRPILFTLALSALDFFIVLKVDLFLLVCGWNQEAKGSQTIVGSM
jgi:hypothetical protein